MMVTSGAVRFSDYCSCVTARLDPDHLDQVLRVASDPESATVALDMVEADGLLAHLTADQRARLDAARLDLMSGDAAAGHVVSIVLDREVKFPVYRSAQVEREFSKLVAKAEKRGLPVPMLVEMERDDQWVRARILGGAPVFDGWRLVADLEQRTLEDGTRTNIVRTAPGEQCPEKYLDAPEQCLHCGYSRTRNRTFVIAHDGGGTTQVGSTCLDEYIGADALQAWLTLGKLSEVADGWAGLEWDEEEFASCRGHVRNWGRAIEPALFVAAVCAHARVEGFASSGSSIHPDLATGCVVWSALQTGDAVAVTDVDRDRSERVLAHARTMDGEFGHNLAAIMDSRVEWSDANMLAAAYAIHDRDAAVLDEHIPHAPVGQRVVLDLEVTGLPYFDDYDYMTRIYMVALRDSAGRRVLWRTSAPYNCEDERLEVGDRVRMACKIKRLGEYQGKAQTQITARGASVMAWDEVKKSAPVMRKWAREQGIDCPEWAWTKAMAKKAAKE